MESMRSNHAKEREGLDDGTTKLKDELRQTRSERNQLELANHELEAVRHKGRATPRAFNVLVDKYTTKIHGFCMV